MDTSRVPGHTLASEGAPYVVNIEKQTVRARGGGSGGTGRALCSCGALSEILHSGRARKDWHRAHKAEMAAQA